MLNNMSAALSTCLVDGRPRLDEINATENSSLTKGCHMLHVHVALEASISL